MKSPVLIGRFQTPQLTIGHKHILTEITNRHDGSAPFIILVAVTPFIPTAKNPLSFACREQIIYDACEGLLIPRPFVIPLVNTESDEEWSKLIDQCVGGINPAGGVIYGGRDNSLHHYKGRYQTITLDINDGVSATAEREKCARLMNNRDKGVEFAEGVTAAMACMPTRTLMAVDVIPYSQVTPSEPGQVLVGRRPHNKLFQFVGGMVDPGESLETAARRELKEETGLDCECPEYLGSTPIDDWRTRYESEKITSAVFLVRDWRGALLSFHEQDELVDLTWMSLNSANWIPQLHPMHHPVLDMLIARLKRS